LGAARDVESQMTDEEWFSLVIGVMGEGHRDREARVDRGRREATQALGGLWRGDRPGWRQRFRRGRSRRTERNPTWQPPRPPRWSVPTGRLFASFAVCSQAVPRERLGGPGEHRTNALALFPRLGAVATGEVPRRRPPSYRESGGDAWGRSAHQYPLNVRMRLTLYWGTGFMLVG
jgi:hypothetical protein